MVGLLGNREPQGSLAGALQGYAPPQMTAMTNPQVMDYARNVAQSAQQNLQTQMSDLDKALVMDQGGINIGDRQALARLMEQIPGLMGATAYHGTPHTIQGKFDINKVGTGEGAQAYGYGMYFAENPSVAKQYLVNAESQKTAEGMARSYLNDYPSKKEALLGAKARLQRLQENGTAELVQQQEQVVKALESNKLGGNLYKVDIPDADIPMMLDYDKPIKDQPEILKKVRNLIKDPDILENFDKNVESGITGANVYANYIPTGVSKFDLLQQRDDLLNKYMTKDMGMSDAVKAMNAEDRAAFSKVAQKIDDLKNKPKLASQVLSEAGIKGIRYLDQGSRGQGGTSNYVVFDPSTVKILEKNKKKQGLLD